MSLRIVADEAIPFINTLFGPFADIMLIPGHKINLNSIMEADALLVRSTTRIHASLLAGSPVKFVGTATAGTDHIDTDYLDSKGIRFVAAFGGNANSVVEYVFAALSELAVYTGESLFDKTVGIIGCGWIGSQLATRLRAMEISCLLCDSPLQEKIGHRKETHRFSELSDLLRDCDVISLHVPLVHGGKHATVDLIAEPELSKMARGSWLLNTARGGVVNERHLLDALKNGPVCCVATDVWSGEPNPDADLVSASFIATSHIAGYSSDAKRQSAEMILDEFCRHFSLPCPPRSDVSIRDQTELEIPDVDPESDLTVYLTRIIRQMYNIREDDARMRTLPTCPLAAREKAFRNLRDGYRVDRYGFERFRLDDDRLRASTAGMLQEALRITVVQSDQVC